MIKKIVDWMMAAGEIVKSVVGKVTKNVRYFQQNEEFLVIPLGWLF